MNNLLDIVPSSISSESKFYSKLLSGFDDHQVFQLKATNEIDAITSAITNALNSQSNYYEGLLLLKSFLSQVQLDLVEQKGGVWLSLCLKFVSQKRSAITSHSAYDVIGLLLEKSVHIPELSKAVTSNFLGKIFESFVNQVPECRLAVLKCMQTCMQLFPGSCGTSRGIIEHYLAALIDEDDVSVVREVGRCYHLVQQIRGGATHGNKQRDSWSLHQLRLIYVTHNVIDALYANTTETVDGNAPVDDEELQKLIDKWPPLKLSSEPAARVSALFIRLRNQLEFLRITLCESFPTPKLIQVDRIFTIIVRGLDVNCNSLVRNLITDNIVTATLLPQIHVSVFKLLDTMILLLKTNLLSETKTILQLIIQSLRWTSSGKAYGFRRPFASIRQSAYCTLSLWCKIAASGSLIETIADELIRQIIQDVTPFKNEVTMQVLSGGSKHLSKRAKQKLQKAQNDASHMAQMHSKAFNSQNAKLISSDNGNESICLFALNALTQVILAVGCFIKPLHQKILQENIISIALQTISGQLKRSNMYYDANCRLSLYSVIHALIVNSHYLCPPPTQYAVRIFSVARIRDVDIRVRDRCNELLTTIEKILHPQKETFYFPTNVNDVYDAFKKNAEELGTFNVENESEDDEEMEIDETQHKENEKIETTKPSPVKVATELSKASPVKIVVSESPRSKLNESPKIGEKRDSSVESNRISSEPQSTPPRKSMRLMQSSPSATTEDDTDSQDRLEAPLTRRRSTRLRTISVSSQKSPSKKDDEKKFPVIVESEASQKEIQIEASATEQKLEDKINELAATFVDEFLD